MFNFNYAPGLASSFLVIFFTVSPCFALKEPPFSLPSKQEIIKLKTALVSTNKGELYFELYPESAPWHVANFKYLADKGFYRNTSFHLFYPDYIIQGGAPSKNPNSGPGYTLPPEFNQHKHDFGALGMARKPDIINSERRSHGSQFHILLGEATQMNGSYTVFGRITRGKEVLESLEKGDVIKEVVVYVREEVRP